MITTVINSQNKTPFGKFIHTIKSTSVLDWLNFLIVDVKDALGLFLVMYLFSSRLVSGIIMMIGGTATALVWAPIGALIGWSSFRRGLIVSALIAFLLYWIAMPETGPAKLMSTLNMAMQDA